ncbi:MULTISPECIES: phage portal protein [Acinetobacter calcoaceticus/baumannii complex]|uniref:Phage portal protein n=1 Tax=Acinetobacter nosocomialis TaxID=106654 RepID=A0AB36M4V5_ACINO|nr:MULTISPECIES: phage portal protein [Acinetobacter calcoaceticus/baumannii complex]MBZ6534923.1 phage portal protein [Acinetobacter seifertii]OTM00023.1 phage portal protein [Acinetobacter nosocomialis]
MKPIHILKSAFNAFSTQVQTVKSAGRAEAFTFGDPVPVLSNDLSEYMECWFNGRWYEPAVSIAGLSKSFRATPYLSSGIFLKRNYLVSQFIPHPLLSRSAFEQIAFDYIWSGNAYLEEIRSLTKKTIKFKPSLSKYMRVGQDDRFFMITNDHIGYSEYEFPEGRITHIRESDIDQEIYGKPEYIAALQSLWLNESATLFRRKYYNNGSHAGFIMYVNDPANDPQDIDNLRQALKDSKGPGNFRNLFYYSPNGKKDGVQIIPVSEIAAKDDFANIKNITRDDVLASLRIPPQLMGIVPNNSGGFGSVTDAEDVFYSKEIVPLQSRLSQINELTGIELIRFKEYDLKKSA